MLLSILSGTVNDCQSLSVLDYVHVEGRHGMADKKARIIHSAIEIFSEKGIDKTKVSDIVKRAGIAQGTFYLYFSSKLAVMPSIAEVMVKKILEEVKQHIDQKASFSEQLRQVVDIVFKITKDYRDIFALIYAGLASTEYLQEWEAIYAPYYEWMSDFLEEARNDGVIRQSIHPDQTAVLLIGLIESAAEQAYLYSHGDQDAVTAKKQELLHFLEHALGLTK